MMRPQPIAIARRAFILLPLPAVAAGRSWDAASDGFVVRITPDDIQAGRAGRAPAFSARADARRAFRRIARAPDVQSLNYDRTTTVVSLCGPFLGLREEEVIDNRPAAHPAGQTRLRTLDLRLAGGGTVDLRDIAGRPALARALGLPLAGLRDATEALGNLAADVPADNRAMDGCFHVPEDWSRRFAIHQAGPQTLGIRIGLPAGSGACRWALTQVPFDIPLPPTLRGLPLRRPPPGLATLTISFRTGT